MKISIRQTNKSEFFQTENLTRETFWNLYESGCTVHLVLHQLRKSSDYIPELDLVAIYDGQIIGHIIATKAYIEDNDQNKSEVLCIGPLGIEGQMQGKGLGNQLMKYCISKATAMNYKAIMLFGNPAYYHRFGYLDAQNFGICTRDGKNFPAFMALELRPAALKGIQGRFLDSEAYITSEKDLNEFEKFFPPKEKGEAKIKISI